MTEIAPAQRHLPTSINTLISKSWTAVSDTERYTAALGQLFFGEHS
jgi:hypothetical protein